MSKPAFKRPPMTALEWGILLTLSVVWGGSFFFNSLAVKELPVFTVVVSRVVLAALVLFTLLRLKGEHLPCHASTWAAFFGMGLLNNVLPFSLIVWGQQHIASGVASILNASTPLFTAVFAHFLTHDERMTKSKLIGVMVGFGGVAVMVGIDAVQDLGTHTIAALLCLAGAISYGFAGIFGRRFHSMGLTPMSTATGQVIASSLLLLPLVIAIDQPWTLSPPSLTAIGALVGVAVISTAFAYVLYFRLLATVGASNLLLVTFLIPVSAILLGTTFLGETLQTKHITGMALIVLGLATIDGRPWRAATSVFTYRKKP
jgi:drug/metabolite transporter (DMT)-like permease